MWEIQTLSKTDHPLPPSHPPSNRHHKSCFVGALTRACTACVYPSGVWSSRARGSSSSFAPDVPLLWLRFLRNGPLVLPHQLKRRREKDAVRQKRVISEGKEYPPHTHAVYRYFSGTTWGTDVNESESDQSSSSGITITRRIHTQCVEADKFNK
jgi:hypothetical protein